MVSAMNSDPDHRNCEIFHTIRKTALQMCSDRGYLVSQAELEQNLDQFKAQFGSKASEDKPSRNDLTILVSHKDDAANQMYVFFADEPKFGVKTIKYYTDQLVADHVSKAIIVVQNSLSSAAMQAIKDLSPQYDLEIFVESELMINITEHVLNPKFFVMTQEEKSDLLKKYSVTENKLPRIQSTDPVARYFGLKKGQCLGIIRTSETAGFYHTCRICI